MKKKIYSLSLLSSLIFLFSCVDEKKEELKNKSEDSKCKYEFAHFLVENGTNTMVLGKRLGLEKDLEAFNKIQLDTSALVTCDSVKNSWQRFSALVQEKSNSK